MMYQLSFCILTMVIFFPCSVAGPIHASCKITWTFGISCQAVEEKITEQMKKWSGKDCGTGEKCLYTVTKSTISKIEGTHQTPVKHYVDDLSFTLNPGSKETGCNVEGYSTSETWYAVLDYGTNYCNLHNLITGSGLDKVAGYKETTSNSRCTQYSSANCAKY